MNENAFVQEVAGTLASAGTGGLAAGALFDRYASLQIAAQREAYVAALIGELLVAKARAMHAVAATGRGG